MPSIKRNIEERLASPILQNISDNEKRYALNIPQFVVEASAIVQGEVEHWNVDSASSSSSSSSHIDDAPSS